MKTSLVSLLFVLLVSTDMVADEIFFLDGTDDLDIVAQEGWVFIEDSAFLDIDINQTVIEQASIVEEKQPEVNLFDFDKGDKSECGSSVITKKKEGCKSSR